MKVLVTADWHLGRYTLGVNFLPYQEKLLLTWLLDEVLDQYPTDLLVVAGDIFDSKHPSAGALTLFSTFAARLSERNVPALFLAGNHDLPELIRYMEELLRHHGLYSISSSNWSVDNARLPDFPDFVAVPHLSRYHLGSSKTLLEIYQELADRYDPAHHILLLHLTIGALGDEGWEVIGHVPTLDPKTLAPWKLVISGHLHGYHQPATNVVYPGSLLKYHSNEYRQSKRILWLDTDTGRWEAIPVPQIIDMACVDGRMDNADFYIEKIRHEPDPDATCIIILVGKLHSIGSPRLPQAVVDAVKNRWPDKTLYYGSVLEYPDPAVSSENPLRNRFSHTLHPRELIEEYLRQKDILNEANAQSIADLIHEIWDRMEAET